MAVFNNQGFLNVNLLTGTPSAQSYTTLTIEGGITIGNIRIRDKHFNDTINYNTTPLYDTDTILLVTFVNNRLDGGSISGLDNDLTNFDIYRREVGGDVATRVVTLDANARRYVDYTQVPNKNYIYEWQGYNASERSDVITSEPINTNYYGFYLIDASDDADNDREVFFFENNVSAGDIENVKPTNVVVTNNKYPTIIVDNTDFYEETLRALPSNTTSKNYSNQDVDLMEALRNFINNNKPKFFKTRQGRIMKVHTHELNKPIFLDEIPEQLHYIEFKCTEIGDVE